MDTTRRDLLKLGALAGLAQGALASAAHASTPAPAQKLKILILGGTGFTGPHQIRYALARGHEVTVLTAASARMRSAARSRSSPGTATRTTTPR